MRILPLPDPRHRPRAGRAPNPGTAANQVRFPENGPGGKDARSAAAVAKHSVRPQLPCPHPSGIRADRPPPGRHRRLAAKSVLKIQHQPTPPLHGSRPHTAGRTTTCLPERNQEAPATLQHPDQGAGTARGRSTGIPASPGPGAAAAARRQPEPARQACSQGTGNGVEVMQVGMVTANGP
jgi:hypothetical protein